MSDEQDRTREFAPFDDDDATVVRGSHPIGDPRTGDPGGPDRTRQMPSAAGDAAVPGSRPPRRDSTSILPQGADAWNAASGAGPAWSGRAQVRAPQPGEQEYVRTDWTVPAPREPRGRGWMPIGVGIAILLLLGLLGRGIWLIGQATCDDPATPTPAVPTS